jgi:hydrogenase-4 component F
MALFGTLVTYYAGHSLAGSDALSGLNWSVLAQHAAQLDKTSMRLAFVLILLGYGTKAGLAPMHTWKPDAYSEAPVPSAAILSSALLNCALYGLIRFYILTSRCLGPEYPGHLLLLFGLLSMGISVPFILVQQNYRRLLAYHTIDHAGIMDDGARSRRRVGQPGPDAAHGLSHHREIAALSLRGQRLPALPH